MPKPKNSHGIFCLETIWFDERAPPSVRSLLELLERLSNIPFVHRDISTWEELDFCLGRWVGRDMYKKDYWLGDLGILYLGFHGSPGKISLRTDSPQRIADDEVDLDEIAKSLTHCKSKYNVRGCVIHFASCSVLRAEKQVEDFKNRVGAACVSGYSKQVDSTTSWAFELMFLELLSRLLSEKNVNVGTLQTLDERIQNKPEYAGLSKALGFKMIY